MDTGIKLHFRLSVSYDLLQSLLGQRLLLGGKQLLVTNNAMKKLEKKVNNNVATHSMTL